MKNIKSHKLLKNLWERSPDLKTHIERFKKLEPIDKSLNFACQEPDTTLSSLLVTNEKILSYQITQAEELLSEITQEVSQADCGSMTEHDPTLMTKIEHLKTLLNVLLEKDWRGKKCKTDRGTKLGQDTEYNKAVGISWKLERIACAQHQKEVEMRRIKIWHDVYKTYTEYEISFARDSVLFHNIKDYLDFRMLTKVGNLALPPMRKVRFSILYCRSKENSNFFKEWFPPTINSLIICSKGLAAVGGLLLRISPVSHRILESIFLDSFKISGSQLKRFFMLVKHVKYVSIRFCKLSFTEVIDLERCLKGTTIEKLCTVELSRSNCSDWGNKPEGFSNFIESLSKSDLKISLQTIYIGERFLCETFIKQVLAGSELNHVDLNME
ncbi:unnamed protein product [Moneuplotes crassus]|uniref:Uncharacterized protein n=1 Tax=Euplotes crassus TaxID=5936 RepID=A0AAD1UEY2_EUPCR|nr:unnamed protein product [Moneuplotes crassus]